MFYIWYSSVQPLNCTPMAMYCELKMKCVLAFNSIIKLTLVAQKLSGPRSLQYYTLSINQDILLICNILHPEQPTPTWGVSQTARWSLIELYIPRKWWQQGAVFDIMLQGVYYDVRHKCLRTVLLSPQYLFFTLLRVFDSEFQFCMLFLLQGHTRLHGT